MPAKPASTKSSKASKHRFVPSWRYLAWITLLTLLLVGGLYGSQQVEYFLIHDPRFTLAPAAEYGDESPNLHIEGVRYASRRQVLRIFEPDIGRSLYLFPLTERRKQLLRIPWIKEAAITRTWPNHIAVRISERTPAAFVALPTGSISRWALIDSDGIILDPPGKASFNLPVLTGIRPQDPIQSRSTRVHRMQRMLEDLGTLRDKVSDVNAADLDDLQITIKMDNRPVVLMLGDHNFRSRFQTFLDHYEEIQKRISGMTVLDLRLDDRITVIGGNRT